MNTLKKLSIAASLTATGLSFGLVIFAAKSASAVVINGDFENGFNRFDTTGDASIQTSSFGSGPTSGDSQALITNGDGSATGSGIPSVPIADVERFLGLSSGTLSSSATEGSAIKQTLTGSAGDVLSFDFNFLTNEPTQSSNNDFSFVTLNDSLISLADTSSSLTESNTVFNLETGFQTSSLTIPADGSYTLGFGVVDVGDGTLDSGFLVDNIQETAPVPFELSPGLGILLLGAWGAAARLIRKRSPITKSLELGLMQRQRLVENEPSRLEQIL